MLCHHCHHSAQINDDLIRSSASESTPSTVPVPSLPLPDVESYKILDHLHLGLNVKIGATYSRQELEARCKGNEPHCKVRVQWVLWWFKMEKMVQYRNITITMHFCFFLSQFLG